ncbi:MAG TPA: hypothetical protein VMS92_13460, partial [Mycobacterium sp.]|nr:hypothetical protein [Mycobacterium sp.]
KGTDGWIALGETVGDVAVELGVFATRLIAYFKLVSRARQANREMNEAFSNWDFKGMLSAGEKAQTDLDALLNTSEGLVDNMRKSTEEAKRLAQVAREIAAGPGNQFKRSGFETSGLQTLPTPTPEEIKAAARAAAEAAKLLADVREEAFRAREQEGQDAARANAAAEEQLKRDIAHWSQLREAMLDADDPARVIRRRMEEVDEVISRTFDDEKRDALLRYRNTLVDDLGQAFNKTKDRVEETKDSVQELTELLKGGLIDFSKDAASQIVDAFSGAKVEIDQIVKSILASIAKVMLQRAIMRGIDAYMNPFTPNLTAPSYPPAVPFAHGGVVSSPTMFAHGGGVGIMGEVPGVSEAIVPLRRTSSGDLGVQASPVNVTVINSAGASVKTEESRGANGEQQLRIMIDKAVEEGLGRGRFDRVLSTSYGIPRKGR